MGFVGLAAELLVLGCIAVGLAGNVYVVTTCDVRVSTRMVFRVVFVSACVVNLSILVDGDRCSNWA